jgi:hypothetical protein
MFPLQMSLNLMNLANPIVRVEKSRVRWLGNPAKLRRFQWLALTLPFVAALTWWLGSIYLFASAQGHAKFDAYTDFSKTLEILLIGTLGISVLAALVVDFYSLIVTIASISHEAQRGHLDLLRLTAITPTDYADSKFAIGEMRAWRPLVIEIAVRVLTVVLTIAAMSFSPYYSYGWSSSGYGIQITPLISQLHQGLVRAPLKTIFDLLMIGMFIVLYIAEPLCRMRVLVAVGLAISTRLHNITMASLVGVAFVVGLHMFQIAVFWLGGNIYASLPYPYRYSDEGFLGIFVGVGLVLFTTYYGAYCMARLYTRRAVFRPEV